LDYTCRIVLYPKQLILNRPLRAILLGILYRQAKKQGRLYVRSGAQGKLPTSCM
jgi:hypothetical protein